MRMATRRCNPAIIWASRVAFSHLFYGTNMTNYQDLHLCDLKTRVQMPCEVSSAYDAYMSISPSGHHSKGEGVDFILEAKNRRVKMWLPPGAPTQQQWLRVCRNLDKLDEVLSWR